MPKKNKKTSAVKMTMVHYSESYFERKTVKTFDPLPLQKNKGEIIWIDVDGLHEKGLMEKIKKHFNLHPLLAEDIVSTTQRPKIEDFEGNVFIAMKKLDYDEKAQKIMAKPISIVFGENFLFSFHEKNGDLFGGIQERIKDEKGNFRKAGADYLAYSLIDEIVDHYFTVLEKMEERIENSEGEVLKNPSSKTAHNIHQLKREIISLRKSVWPLREVINHLEKEGSELIKKQTHVYLRDLYDHVIQIIDTVETFRDILEGMLEVYLSSVSNKMNEIMKVLTIIATIFIPLTFITGVYGMNFKHMPELEWYWGYFFIWGIIASVGGLMLFYFRKKKWM